MPLHRTVLESQRAARLEQTPFMPVMVTQLDQCQRVSVMHIFFHRIGGDIVSFQHGTQLLSSILHSLSACLIITYFHTRPAFLEPDRWRFFRATSLRLRSGNGRGIRSSLQQTKQSGMSDCPSPPV